MNRGFTLVELLVAMFLTSIIGVLAYALFATTADNLQEVDSLEATASKARFSVERLRRTFQAAASGGTPDSELDRFVQPRPPSGLPYLVSGFLTYPGWQGVPTSAANPWVSNDGVILAGAFDFPTSFEAAGFETSAPDIMRIPGHYRGMERLAVPDPFSDVIAGPVPTPNLGLTRDWSDFNSYDFFQRNFDTRIIRIVDAQGYTQFVAPAQALTAADVNGPTTSPFASLSVPLDLATAFVPRFKDPNRPDWTSAPFDDLNMSEIGLDLAAANEGDRGYDAMLIDAFWFHVIPSPSDPNDQLLIMERLCAKNLFEDAINIATVVPDDYIFGGARGCGNVPERYVVTDKLVDFQVWFDCADTPVPDPDDPGGDPIGYNMSNNPNWNREWLTPDNVGTCAEPNTGTFLPGRARVAHFRMTLRAANERKDLNHYQFEVGDTVCNNPTACPGASLRTFDIAENVEGAAPVVTVQSDVQLYNYAIRDL